MNLLHKNFGLAFLAGAACVFGFAPFGIFPIPVFALAVLFTLQLREATPRGAAGLGYAFGLGLFATGISWIYVALHDYGDMPAALAAPATLLFSAFLALFPALTGYAQARFNSNFISKVKQGGDERTTQAVQIARPGVNEEANAVSQMKWNWNNITRSLRLLLVMPALWVSVEWLRGMIFTGFPWLTLGYAHSDSPLAGYAPLLGVYGVSLASAVSAGLLVLAWQERRHLSGKLALVALLSLWGAGALLRTVAWTQTHGEPLTVALVQGNIAQELKFNEDALIGTLETYRRLVLQSEARLIVLPETALPVMRDEVPQNLAEQLRNHARQNGGDVLIGAFERDRGNYYNSAFSLGTADEQHYRKNHLVPFGEFIPLRPMLGWFINGVLDIPMGDLARGDEKQAPLNIAGQHVAVNICYEDVFGEEIIRALPQATLLINVTNDAWYGDSHAAAQHNQISQMRAMESGRMMLRATNTGVTSIIAANGEILQQLPQHVEAVLQGQVQGYEGLTPYARWGNAAVLLLIALMLAGAWMRAKNYGTAG